MSYEIVNGRMVEVDDQVFYARYIGVHYTNAELEGHVASIYTAEWFRALARAELRRRESDCHGTKARS